MGRIEILRSRYVLQLLIFVSGGGEPPLTLGHISARFEALYGHQNVFVDFDFGKKNPAGAQYNRHSTAPAHNCFALK